MAHTESMSAPKDRIRVVAAVIQRDGRFLVCQRSHLKRHGGLWEFPGGKIELSETIEAAAERELKEELALEVTGIGRTLLIQMDPGSPFQIEFVEVFAEGDPRALEHEEVRWVLPSELELIPLAPTDEVFAASLQAMN